MKAELVLDLLSSEDTPVKASNYLVHLLHVFITSQVAFDFISMALQFLCT